MLPKFSPTNEAFGENLSGDTNHKMNERSKEINNIDLANEPKAYLSASPKSNNRTAFNVIQPKN